MSIASMLIEAEERRGHYEMLESIQLPARVLWSTEDDFKALGFKLEPPTSSGDLFRDATLPEGWRREGSSHSMWTYIVDPEGYRRVAVFYKSAFYDRAAHMGLLGLHGQQTAAQAESWDRVAESAGYGKDWKVWVQWQNGRRRRNDGTSYYAYGFRHQDGTDEGFSHDLGTWRPTGRYILIAVDDAGKIIAKVDWTVTHKPLPVFPEKYTDAFDSARVAALQTLDAEAMAGFPGWPSDSGLGEVKP